MAARFPRPGARLMRRLRIGVFAAVSAAALGTVVFATVPSARDRLMEWLDYEAAESRLVTGILATGTPARPVLYVTSSDPRIGGGETGVTPPSDTNSGVLSRLTWSGDRWDKLDLVRGLPRSRSDHATNGMAISADGRTLFIAQGSNTNKGAPSEDFGHTPEYALSGAVLRIDLSRIHSTYDIPTLDDEKRSGRDDENDPFGGNRGRNQARIVPGGPIQVYASGFRNPYDLVLTRDGRLYTIQNGANPGWGDVPSGEGVGGACSNESREGGHRDVDTLHRVREGSYYGHPNPTRGNRSNTFNRDAQSPVPEANPLECDYRPPARRDSLTSFVASTNGITEYTSSSLGGTMRGNLLAASLDGYVYRLVLDDEGDAVVRKQRLVQLRLPLDVDAQGDEDVFPGTVWVAEYASAGYEQRHGAPEASVTVLEPRDLDTRRSWRRLSPSGLARQEVSYVASGGKLYLAGGDRRHQVYDPATRSWRNLAPLPVRLDHIQGVAVGGRVYYIGGLAGWPAPHADSVFVYDPRTDTFSRGAEMPRGRGAGGVAVYAGKIYYAGGLHDGKAVPWLDSYDPAANRWQALSDMPRPRDHFQAAVANAKLYAIGGRDTDIGRETDATDAYAIATDSWTTGLAPLPTRRGGFAAAVIGSEILVIGGEVSDGTLNTVEAYDPRMNSWRTLDPIPTARHGIQAAVCNGGVYVAAGGRTTGGEHPTDVHEVYFPEGPTACGAESAPARAALAGARFTVSSVAGTSSRRATSLQFGPDGRLYVAQQDGLIKIYRIVRRGKNAYVATDTETISAIQSIPNHDDDGSSATDLRSLVDAVRDRLGL